MSEQEPIRLVYILAASHSGSTLLTMLLNAHPDVATVGELAPGGMGDPDTYRCSCGSLIRSCPFWRWLREQAGRRGVPLDLSDLGTAFRIPGSRGDRRLLGSMHRGRALELARDAALGLLPGWRKRFREIAAANELLIRLCLEYYSSRVFVDKGQGALRLKHLLRMPSLDIKVIHLVRDGRGVALTYMDSSRFADAADPSLRGGGRGIRRGTRKPMRKAAYDVRRCFEEAEHVLKGIGRSRQRRVRYEDLCKAPDGTLDDLFRFVGLNPGQRESDFRAVEHHILGNGMRLDSDPQVRLDERWKTILTEDDLCIFDSVSGPMNRRHGYE